MDIPKGHSPNDILKTKSVEIGTLDLFRHSGSRKVTFIMMIDWIAINLGKLKTLNIDKIMSIFISDGYIL